MNRRLPPRPGEWIDREKSVEFRFEGRTYHGYEGDVLSSALWANDVRLLGRSFKYHRPRGIYSLAGWDANVIVEDGLNTNLRGDMLPIRPGLDVRAVNTAGGLARDRLRITEWFSPLLPVGFYYKAFHTPRWLFPLYERLIRSVAGLGSINPDSRAEPTPKNHAFCDLLVVGAGPAGMAGAIAAAELGASVMLVDEQPRPGGSLAWQWAGQERARELLEEMRRKIDTLDTLELRCGTQAAGWYADHLIALCDDRRMTKVRARATLVAGGCFEQPAVFGNNDLPGVMLGSAAQRLVHQYAVKPANRCVVLAANDEGYRVAWDLREAGVDVAAIVDPRPETIQSESVRRAIDAGIAVHPHHTVYEAVPGRGKTRIDGAVICTLDDRDEPLQSTATGVPCDGVIVSVGWAPTAGLLYQAGVRFSYDERVEQFIPASLPESVLAAGRVNGVFDLDDQIADGRRAGLAAAAFLKLDDSTTAEPPARGSSTLPRDSSAPSHPFPIFAHKKGKNFVDFDEDLRLADFANAHQEGYDNIELMKRYTTVGMGPSQGKLANMNAIRILARLGGKTIDETGTTTSRPFHQPVALEHLAGRRLHPLRRTPMHDWHAKADAAFVHAGSWLRPEYYRVASKSRDEAILDEARNTRDGVSLIDVGTLGKIQVSGPDAVMFLERIYTGRFAKLAVGRLRYGLACDEMGVVIEDGVIARLDEHRFYVTATSSGSAAFFREMQRWAILWRANVVLVNATGHVAAMNLVGPHARQVLAGLTDVDLGADAFPYLGVRRGKVAGVPATLLRVGFVGELGYEIHVPASYGITVWDKLMEAGHERKIRPLGVEAQRLLRLEKGHLIVGQDTDALTNPYEADLAWAIGKGKPFFVGQRCLRRIQDQPPSHRLVGIAFPEQYKGPLPEECHLVVDGGDIAGRITSIAHRTTIGRAIGLAYVRPHLSQPGTTVQIRIEGGTLVEAEVVSTPFYDPQNARQN